MTAESLLARARAAGFTVRVVRGKPELLPLADGAEMPPELLADLKGNREAVIALLVAGAPRPGEELCALCGRDVTDPEDHEVIATNPLLCDRGGARAGRDRKTGEVIREASPRCPYKGDAA